MADMSLLHEYELRNSLNRLATQLITKWPWIDNGGCGVVAALVSQELNRIGVPAVGLFPLHPIYSPDCWSIDKARAGIQDPLNAAVFDWEDNGGNFYHIVTGFTLNGCDWVFDATNGCKEARDNYAEGHMTTEEMIAVSITNDYGWNPAFHRGAIPHVELMIKHEMSNTHTHLGFYALAA